MGILQPTTAPGGASTAVLRVVVVDDDVDTAELFGEVLEQAGHTATVVHDSSLVVDIVLRVRPDVVLLDIGMPGLDGYEVAARVRALPELNAVVLIAITGYGGADHRARSAAAGFAHHLIKPVSTEDLERAVLAAASPPL